jgi:hypothetical protein
MPQCPVARLWRVVEPSPVAKLKILCENSQRVRTRNATACYGRWTKWKKRERQGSGRCTLDRQLLPATHDAACHAGKSHYGWSAIGPSSDGRKGRYESLTVTRRKDDAIYRLRMEGKSLSPGLSPRCGLRLTPFA